MSDFFDGFISREEVEIEGVTHASLITRKRPSLIEGIGLLFVELCLVLGLISAGFVAWQVWWTSYQVEARVDEAIRQFERMNPAQAPGGNDFVEPIHRTDDPPKAVIPTPGETFGLLHFPTWGYMRTPFSVGTGAGVLDQGYAGWYEDTQGPGEIGNFALAGHRLTYGNNFRQIHKLRAGDPLVVETDRAYLVYEVIDYEIVTPDEGRVLYPVPNAPMATPTERFITLTSCNDGLDTSDGGQWGNSHRWITYGKLSYWTDKAEGKPSVVLHEEINDPSGRG